MLAIASPCARVVDDLRRPPYPSEDIDASRQLIMIPARVVSRVRIPASQVFELMKVLEKQLSAWELETGQRPPDDTGLFQSGLNAGPWNSRQEGRCGG
jgi:hypothetical protein